MTARFAFRPTNDVVRDQPPGVDAKEPPTRHRSLWQAWLSLLRMRPGRAVLALFRVFRSGTGSFAAYVSAVDPDTARVADAEAVLDVLERSPVANWRAWLRQLRIHQWLKNLLIYVPLVAARRVGNLEMLGTATAAFVAFGCVASATYIINDLLDLPHDRRHPAKRHRPLAAGMISIPAAAAVTGGLLAVGALAASALPLKFAGVLLLYLCGTLTYSLFLKRIAPLDTFALAGLYTLRVLAGNAATGLAPSFWLLVFSIFLFLSLAMAKRHAELLRLESNGESAARGRGYLAADRDMVSQLGVASGYASALVLALYFNSPQATLLYSRPEVSWVLCALLLYWVSHLWLVAHRGRLDDDPVVFAIRDPASRAVAIIATVLLILAR